MDTDPRTDFTGYSHQALVKMLHDSDPGRVVSAGDDWASVGMALHDHAAILEQRLRAYDGMWRGTAATAFHTMVGDLLDGVRQTADSALAIRDQVYHAGEALKTAWAAMPDPVDLPAPGPVLMNALDATAPAAPVLPAAPAALPAPAPPQVVAAANAAQATAAAVMTALATQDVAIRAALPLPPAATVPALAPDGSVLPSGSTAVLNAGGTTAPPVFSRLFTAGLAAVGAAAGGQFGATAFVAPTGTAAAPLAAVPAAALPKGGAGLGKVPGIGGGGGADLTPVASPALSGTPGTAGVTGLTTAATTAGAAGTSSASYLPPMGYGGMTAGDAAVGAGRRIPPWLVETEDVWGEPTAVTPSVIGEDPVDPAAGWLPRR